MCHGWMAGCRRRSCAAGTEGIGNMACALGAAARTAGVPGRTDQLSPPAGVRLPDAPVFFSLRGFVKLLASWQDLALFRTALVEAEFEGMAAAPPRLNGPRTEMTYLGFLEWYYQRSGRVGWIAARTIGLQ